MSPASPGTSPRPPGPGREPERRGSANFGRSDEAGEYTLTAGFYELQIGEQLLRFTVPDGAQIVLSWRATADGANEAVLRSGSQQVAIGADALTSQERNRLARDAGDAESTLSSVVSSLRVPPTEGTVVTSSSTTACVEIEAGEDGTSAVDLELNACAMLRAGGAVTVTVTSGERSRVFSLAADREWLAVEGSLYESGLSAAVTFVDMLSGGSSRSRCPADASSAATPRKATRHSARSSTPSARAGKTALHPAAQLPRTSIARPPANCRPKTTLHRV